jgi:hypothetical protein
MNFSFERYLGVLQPIPSLPQAPAMGEPNVDDSFSDLLHPLELSGDDLFNSDDLIFNDILFTSEEDPTPAPTPTVADKGRRKGRLKGPGGGGGGGGGPRLSCWKNKAALDKEPFPFIEHHLQLFPDGGPHPDFKQVALFQCLGRCEHGMVSTMICLWGLSVLCAHHHQSFCTASKPYTAR